MTASRVAVLITVYNNQKGLDQTIRSVEENAIPGLELVVVNDGSKTPIVLNTRLPAKLIVLEKNSGIAVALNTGLAFILPQNIPYIAIIDADDLAVNNRFAEQLTYLENHPEVGVVGSWIDIFSDKGSEFTLHYPEQDQAIRNRAHISSPFAHPALMFRSSLIHEIGYYSTEREYYAALDFDILVRMMKVTKVYNIPKVLTRYYIANPNSMSNNWRGAQYLARLRILIRNFDSRNIYSYTGILITLGLAILPARVALALKKFRARFLKRA